MASSEAPEQPVESKGGGGGMIWKGVLGGVAVLVAISVAMSLFKLAVIAAVLGGIGYVGYKALGGGGKELPSGKEPRQLTSEIDRRMDELDKLDKKLDEQLAALGEDRNNDRNKDRNKA